MPKHKPSRRHDYNAVLVFIVEYKKNRGGNSPSLKKIMEACGISSTSVAKNIVEEMHWDGKLTIISGKGEPLQFDIPGWSYRPKPRQRNGPEADIEHAKTLEPFKVNQAMTDFTWDYDDNDGLSLVCCPTCGTGLGVWEDSGLTYTLDNANETGDI